VDVKIRQDSVTHRVLEEMWLKNRPVRTDELHRAASLHHPYLPGLLHELRFDGLVSLTYYLVVDDCGSAGPHWKLTERGQRLLGTLEPTWKSKPERRMKWIRATSQRSSPALRSRAITPAPCPAPSGAR
jgi:DNA-binding HxlR family transcriptional regulator